MSISERSAAVTIRRMITDDASAVALLDQHCFACPWSEASFTYEAGENPLARYLVATLPDGTIIGYAGLWIVLDEGHVTNVAVHPQCRRSGIAGLLIDRLMQEAAAEGAARFTLEVRVSNTAARRLYEACGFVEAGLRKSYYEDNGEDAIIMWKEQAL